MVSRVHWSEISVSDLRDRILNDPDSVDLSKKLRRRRHGTDYEYGKGCRCEPCKKAHNDYNQRYRDRTGNGRRSYRRSAGCEDISEADCIALLKSQAGKCAICKAVLKWPNKNTHIDHDHTTGKIRGVLCTRCNTGLGMFKDDPKLVECGLRYLQKKR